MSDRPIQVGDLVVLVKSSCGNEGRIGTAGELCQASCDGTYTIRHGIRRWVSFDRPIIDTWETYTNPAPCPEAWLKRIPPISELEGAQTQEKLRTPTKERV